MATLKLKKPATRAGDRPPVRKAAMKRPTLSQAQAQRQRTERDAPPDRPRRDDAPRHRGPANEATPGQRPRPERSADPRRPRPLNEDQGPGRGSYGKPRPSGRDDRPGPRAGSRDERPRGDRPFGDRPFGDRPFGDRPFGDRPFGDRPSGDRPFSDRPFNDRPRADRPYDDRPRSDRPRRDPRDRRPEGAAPVPRTQRPPLSPARPTVARQGADSTAAPPRRAMVSTGERLSKRLGEMGLASRREADDWIAAGLVRVDGKVAVLGQRIGPEAKIEIDPAARQHQAQRVTILLHKPIGYVSGQAEDGHEPAAVLVKPENRWEDDPSKLKYHPAHLRGLAPAGRLDIDSTGLLVLTQDGRVARALIGEDSVVEKEYLVRVAVKGQSPEAGHARDLLDPAAIELLQHGLSLDDVPLKPAKVSWQNEDQLRFVLREGKKRQIRRMCEAAGLDVLGLKRVRIGRIPLGQLPAGQWRYLAPWEHFN